VTAVPPKPPGWEQVLASRVLDGDWRRVYEYLARTGAKTGPELNAALARHGESPEYHRRASELHAVGCLDRALRGGKAPKGTFDPKTARPNEYTVNGQMPDREKFAKLRKRVLTGQPNTKVFIRGVKDLLAVCRDLRAKTAGPDQTPYQFSDEFLAVVGWLRAVADRKQRERDQRQKAAAAAKP